jgi:hypothetical protein
MSVKFILKVVTSDLRYPGKMSKSLDSPYLTDTVAEPCNHMNLEFAIHVVPASFPRTEEDFFFKYLLFK